MKMRNQQHQQLPNEILQLLMQTLDDCIGILPAKELNKLNNKLDQYDQHRRDIVRLLEYFLNIILKKLKQPPLPTQNINQADYHILEEAVQKSESDVRKHIRVQQQLKLYADSLQEKVEEVSKAFQEEKSKQIANSNLISALKQENSELRLKIKVLQQKLDCQDVLKAKLPKKNSKVTSQISFQDTSINNLKKSLNMDCKRKRNNNVDRLKSKPVSKERFREVEYLEAILKDKQQDSNNAFRNINKDLFDMQKTVNCYEQSQKRQKLISKKSRIQTNDSSLMRCGSVNR